MAQASNRAKSDSLANINHEIRTPMGAIAGLIHILMATNLDDRQKECLTAMRDSANALMTMINDQLDIDKIESRTLNLEHAPFNMPALLQQVVGLMSVKAQEKAIGLSLRYEDGLDKIFTGDGGRIRQIVTNLVGNAIKFTERGKVTVSCASRRNGKGENQISISVTDTGIGIAKYKTGVIFERFIQADPSIALKYGGTGLGLSISKALAESMGGSIAVTSVVGEGSVFTLHLPAELQVVSLQAAAR